MYNCIVIGYGSIGKKHCDNIQTLGHTVSIFDTSEEARKESVESGYNTYSTLKEALNSLSEIVFICTDTLSHIPLSQEVLVHDNPNLKGIFIEKPISHDLKGIDTLMSMCKEKDVKLGSACNLLYLSGISLVKTLLSNNAIGEVYSASYFFGHNLKEWNNRDYKTTYSAGKHGGIMLDDSHSLYLIENLFGNIIEYNGNTHHSKLLDIQNEDAFEIIGSTDRNILVRIHGDYLASEYTRNMEVYGTKGIIQWEMAKTDNNMLESYVYIKTPNIPEWRTFNVSEPLNEMYIREISDFINFVDGKKETFHNGISELNIINKIKEENNGK